MSAEPTPVPPEARVGYVPRCPECDMPAPETEPRVLTEFGWTHPLCAAEAGAL